MSLHKFQHINVPYDQLELFHSPQKNQIFLIQTLLLSTKIILHYQKNNYSTYFVITKHNLWFKDQKKKQNVFALPINSLFGVIKAQQHPQLLFITDNSYDNVRISVSNQQRCNHILSALSYVYTRIKKQNDQVKIIFVKSSNLKQYQKTFQQKIKQNFIFTNFYNQNKHQILTYKQPQKGQIYGSLNLQRKRVQLIKQIFTKKNHMIHIAKLVQINSNNNNSYQSSSPLLKLQPCLEQSQLQPQTQTQKYFYLHTIQKAQQQQIIQELRNYQLLPYDDLGEELVYVRQLDYKIQLFFKYLPQVPKQGSPYYTYQLTPERLFINLMEFYDIILYEAPQVVMDFSLLCFENVYPRNKNTQKYTKCNKQKQALNTKRSFRLNEQYNNSFSQIILKLRQFRYEFLLTQNNDLKKLIYQCYYQKGEIVYDPHSWKTKFYHLSLILYEFMYGKQYFSTQLDPETILKMKMKKNFIFPNYLNTQSNYLMSYDLQDFMQKAIKLKFKSLEDVYSHSWMKQNVMILAHQHMIRKIKKEDDKKTDATKSF